MFKQALKKMLYKRIPTMEEMTTITAKAVALINNRPLNYQSNAPGEQVISPNHFLIHKLYENLAEIPMEADFRTKWQFVHRAIEEFWTIFIKQTMVRLNKRTKWNEKTAEINVGDPVIILDPIRTQGEWPVGIVTEKNADESRRNYKTLQS